MTDVVSWRELTPQAQDVMRAELEELLTRVPNRAAVPVVREQIESQPELIPGVLSRLRRRLASDG